MWAIPNLMGRTCNTGSPHIHHLCYWPTVHFESDITPFQMAIAFSTVPSPYHDDISDEKIRHPVDPKRGGVSVQSNLCLTFLFTEIAFCGFAWYAFRPPSLPSLSFPRVSIPLGLMSSYWINNVINTLLFYIYSDSEFHITLCSASYCYKTIFIIKSWIFAAPRDSSILVWPFSKHYFWATM